MLLMSTSISSKLISGTLTLATLVAGLETAFLASGEESLPAVCEIRSDSALEVRSSMSLARISVAYFLTPSGPSQERFLRAPLIAIL